MPAQIGRHSLVRKSWISKTLALLMGVGAGAISTAQSPLTRSAEYSCVACHRNESRSQPATPMGQAASRAIDADILRDHPDMRFTRGAYTYAIHRETNRVTYSVSKGKKTFSAPIVWAFGVGSIGQTYLYENRGDLYESEVSFYTPIQGLDITIGHGRTTPSDVEEAAGRRLPAAEKSHCLECHMTGSSDALIAGVLCDRCHTNALEHARTSNRQIVPRVMPEKLSLLTKDQLSNFCGECHRTYQYVVSHGTMNVNNVRSQPYRLATSKCYKSSDDKRISCVACHDPHRDLVKNAAYYDAKCQACHASGDTTAAIKTCPVGTRDCVSCHMPRVNFPDGHSRFTDHRIRIVKPGAPYPG
jgi:hypothetical protein